MRAKRRGSVTPTQGVVLESLPRVERVCYSPSVLLRVVPTFFCVKNEAEREITAAGLHGLDVCHLLLPPNVKIYEGQSIVLMLFHLMLLFCVEASHLMIVSQCCDIVCGCTHSE